MPLACTSLALHRAAGILRCLIDARNSEVKCGSGNPVAVAVMVVSGCAVRGWCGAVVSGTQGNVVVWCSDGCGQWLW